MSFLDGLNDEQMRAVSHNDGPMLVVAGAGTGKTQVITRRIARLIEEKYAKPTEILALTFTEKAAQEMSDRLYGHIGWLAVQVSVLTFNSFGSELLNRFAGHIGRSTRGGLINDTQKVLLLSQYISNIEMEYYMYPADKIEFCKKIITFIGKLQNAGILAEDYDKCVREMEKNDTKNQNDIAEQRDLARIYSLYEKIKQQTGTYDFSDQITLPLRILDKKPNLAERLRGEYKYVLVDEYQDTSPVQDRLIRSFVPKDGNIFAVGDDDQAIYGFRGSDVNNILDFRSHFSLAKAQVLTKNYRSGQEILDLSYRMICVNNPYRLESILGIEKKLTSEVSSAITVCMSYSDPDSELEEVCQQVKRDIESGVNHSDIAVLARSNAMLKKISIILERLNIEYSISTSINIFKNTEIVQLWHLLNWLIGRADDETIAHLLVGPYVGWTLSDYKDLQRTARERAIDIESALSDAVINGNQKAADLQKNLQLWREWMNNLPVSNLAYKLIFDTGISEKLLSEAKNGKESHTIMVFEDLKLLLNHMLDFEGVSDDPHLSAYLRTYIVKPEIENPEILGNINGVSLLTIHASKGLEFDTVYVVGCTSRAWSERNDTGPIIPDELLDTRAIDPLHEQRRLMYVATTRAKRKLAVSFSSKSSSGINQQPVVMVNEMFNTQIQQYESSDQKTISTALADLSKFDFRTISQSVCLPFEKENGWIEIGVSSADLYDRCPYEFYLQHVIGITEPVGVGLSFGSIVHKLVQNYFEHKKRGESCELADLINLLTLSWDDRGYGTKEDSIQARNRAERTITNFFHREESTSRVIVGIEEESILEIPEAKIRLKGRMDACFETENGVDIRDFKTGLKKDPEKLIQNVKESFQLRTYVLAYKQMTGADVASVTLDYLVTGIEAQTTYSQRVLENHLNKLIKIANNIRAMNFEPAAESEYHHCPAYKYFGEGK